MIQFTPTAAALVSATGGTPVTANGGGAGARPPAVPPKRPYPPKRLAERSRSELQPLITASLNCAGSVCHIREGEAALLEELQGQSGKMFGCSQSTTPTPFVPPTTGASSKRQSAASLGGKCEFEPIAEAGDEVGMNSHCTDRPPMSPRSRVYSTSIRMASGTVNRMMKRASCGSGGSHGGAAMMAELHQIVSQCRNCSTDYRCQCCAKCSHLLFFYSPVGTHGRALLLNLWGKSIRVLVIDNERNDILTYEVLFKCTWPFTLLFLSLMSSTRWHFVLCNAVNGLLKITAILHIYTLEVRVDSCKKQLLPCERPPKLSEVQSGWVLI